MLSMRSLMPWSGHRETPHGKRDVMHPFDLLHRDVERVFEDFWRDFDLGMYGRMDRPFGSMMPKMDLMEDEDKFRMTFELPGLDDKDVEVELKDNVLTVKGEKKVEKEEKEETYSYSERSFGSFYRSIPLTGEVLPDKIEANFEKGVLMIVLPKSPEAKVKSRKIPVHTVRAKQPVKHVKPVKKAA